MTFAITEEQRLLAESLHRMLAESNEFDVRRKRLCASPPQRLALWPQLAELGVMSAAFDEAHGGFAGDPRTMVVILAELGVSLAVEPFLGSTVMAGRVLQQCTSTTASGIIESLVDGREICVLAHDAGADPFASPLAIAEHSGDSVVLSGMVRCVRHADVANSFLVSATCDGAAAIYHLPRESAGLTLETYRLIDGSGAADLHLQSLPVAANTVLTFTASADAVLHDALDWGLLGLAAETAGIVHALNQATFSYLNARKQFGMPLSSFQALQHRAADMYIAAEEISAAVNTAIEGLVAPASPARSATLAAVKVVADSGGRRIGHEAVQLHGGMGVSDELNVSHYARRLAAIRTQLGSADVHRLRFGSLQ
jgi:alkylation response protein AidB-like acyl-CoA dehydrogenase